MKIIDAHIHILDSWAEPKWTDRMLEVAARFDIQWLAVSMGTSLIARPTAEQIRRDNDHVLSLMKRYPNRITGYCYLNPRLAGWQPELQRCVDAGMRGIKLWIACRCDDPAVFPIAEQAIDLKIPILQHTWKKTTGNGENESEPRHLAALAARYPEAKFIMAHTGGCWQYGLKAARPFPNVMVDTAGGDPTEGFIEMALRELGPRRILFGSDACLRSFASQLAKVDGPRLSPETRRRILRENAATLLGL